MASKILMAAVSVALSSYVSAAPLIAENGVDPQGQPAFKQNTVDSNATFDGLLAKDDKVLIGARGGVNVQISGSRQDGSKIDVVVNGPTKLSNMTDLGDGTDNPPSLLLVTRGSTLKLNGDVSLISESINGANMRIGGINTLYAEDGSVVDVGLENTNTTLIASGVKPDVIQSVRGATVNVHSLKNLVVGNVDFLANYGTKEQRFGAGSTISMTMGTPDSVWFGDEVNGNNVYLHVTNFSAPSKLTGLASFAGYENHEDFTTTLGSKHLNDLISTAKGGASLASLFGLISAEQAKKISELPTPSEMHGTFNLTLKNGGQWIYLGSPDGGEKDLSFGGASGHVVVRSMPERISNITLDGGIVNLHDADVERMLQKYKIREHFPQSTISSAHDVVVLGNVRGNGIFRIDLVEDKPAKGPDTDMIFIENADKGTTATIEPYGIEKLTGISETKHLRFATVAEQAKDNVTFADKVNVEGKGLSDYELYIGSQDHVADERYDSRYTRVNPSNYKYAFSFDGGKDWYIYRITKLKSSDRISLENVGLSVYDAITDMDRHDRRMLEQDFYNEQKKGLWAQLRYVRSGVKNTYDGYLRRLRIGGDRLVKEHHRLGLGLSFAESNVDYAIPSGKHGFKDGYMRNWELMAYDTYRKGLFYYDLVGRLGYLKDRLGNDVTKPDYSSAWRQRYLGLSLEIGRKRLNKDNHEYFLEPEAQLAWTYMFGGKASIGNLTANPGGHALIGRLGFRLGREWYNKKKNKNDLYVKADILHSFLTPKDMMVRSDNDSGYVSWSSKRTWVRLGVGGSYHASRNWDIHGDVSTNLGSNWRHNYLLNLNIRRQF